MRPVFGNEGKAGTALRAGVGLLAVVLLVGCAPTEPGGSDPSAGTPPPVTVPEVPMLDPPSESVRAVAVPNVVGMQHQQAQDTMQAAGFFYLTEEDATGQGRLLVSDRNWVVVEQVPAAGAVTPQSDKILLRSKKKTDP